MDERKAKSAGEQRNRAAKEGRAGERVVRKEIP